MSRSVNGTLIETHDVHAACMYLDAFVSGGCDTQTLNENKATLLSCLHPRPFALVCVCVLIMPVYTYVHIHVQLRGYATQRSQLAVLSGPISVPDR